MIFLIFFVASSFEETMKKLLNQMDQKIVHNRMIFFLINKKWRKSREKEFLIYAFLFLVLRHKVLI